MKEVLGHGGPAFLRRARRVEQAWDALLAACRSQRAEMLRVVSTRLALLHAAVAGDWQTLAPFVDDADQVVLLSDLFGALSPKLRAPVPAGGGPRVLRRAARELVESIERFNRRWRARLDSLNLSAINALRDGYNRYYVLEKEFAVRSARVARQGFVPLTPLTVADVERELPLLPVPRVKT